MFDGGREGNLQQSEYCDGRSSLSSETQAALCSCRTGEDGRPVLAAAAGMVLVFLVGLVIIRLYVQMRRFCRAGQCRMRR